MATKKKAKATAKPAAPQPAAVHISDLASSDHPAAEANRASWDRVTKPKRRRRRRRTNQLLSQRLVTEVNQKKRTFLREVGAMLTDALGFEVRVSLAPKKVDLSPDMRRAARMTKKQARRQMADAAQAPVRILPVTKHADGTSTFVVPAPLGTTGKRRRTGKATKPGDLNDGIPF
jgi:hypothetical protein